MCKQSNIGAKLFIFVCSLFLGINAASASNSPWLGVAIETVPKEALAEFGQGALVTKVLPDSAAAEAGVLAGDVISSFDRQAVSSAQDLKNLVSSKQVGETVMFEALREGEKMTFNATLSAAMPTYGNTYSHRANAHHQGCKSKNSEFGANFKYLNSGLREFFGVDADVGLLVSVVADDRAAAKAGVKVGDVIVRMDRKTIATMKDVKKVLNYFEPGDEIDVVVVRDKQTQTLKVVLGAVAKGACAMKNNRGKGDHAKSCASKGDKHGHGMSHHDGIRHGDGHNTHRMPNHPFVMPVPGMTPPPPVPNIPPY